MAAQEQPAQQQQTQPKADYTPAEYNAYTAAANEKNPQQRLKLLDDFVAKYPSSSLLGYAYRVYYQTYNELKNPPKVIEFADKELALGDKVDPTIKLEAYYLRSVAYYTTFNEKDPSAAAAATRAREAAQAGLKLLAEMKPPQGTTEEQWAQTKKQVQPLLNSVVGLSSGVLKDYKSAIEGYKAAIADAPTDPVLRFRLGVAYLQMQPPQYLDAFWALAQSISLKGPTEAQVRPYLRKQLLNYQQPSCENLIDAQMNELISLAASSPARPDTYKFPSAADLDAARKAMTIASVVTDLKAGGEKAKITWLAACGAEFPEVPGKVIEVVPETPAVVLKVAFVMSEAEFNAATTADMEVRIENQPEAARIEKDNPVHFTGTLSSYDPSPLMIHWTKATVNKDDIPAEKPGKAPRKAPAKRPAGTRRPPAKKPTS
jgi:tetratricopeptide (TPR) repeat protein